MFGYLRLLLAFLVLVSHVDVRFYGLNPGVVAVVVFYMLAGHVVSRLWTEILPPGPGKLLRFYKDRLLRILPLYLYIACLTLLFLIITGYGNPDFSPVKMLNTFLIIPLNYYMVLDNAILLDFGKRLIPPAWSLGAELQAYLILPLVFLSRRIKMVLVFSSLAVYMLANLSVLHPDYFGYRLIAGVFFIFVLGSSIRIQHACPDGSSAFDRLFPWLVWGGTGISGMVFYHLDLFGPAYTRETFIGLLMGIPLVTFLGKSSVRLPYNALLGSLSYGVFLGHFPVKWWLDHTGWIDADSMMYIPAIMLGSLALAYGGVQALEKRVDAVRKKKK
jgi:peptidoglycan/LPS O-acetylase OafA/YrhL